MLYPQTLKNRLFQLAALAFVVLLSLPLAAQERSSLLWEVTGKQLDQPSYVYGTYHTREKRAHLFGDSVLAKIQRCDVVAGEIDQLGDLELDPVGTLTKVMMPPGQSLKDLLKKKQYKKVQEFARRRMGLMSGMINKIKPFYTMALVQEMGAGAEMEKTVDDFLMSYGRDNGKTVIGLETVDEQLNAIDAIPLKDQAQMLVDYVDDYQKMTQQYNEMMEFYFTQEIDKLWEYYESMQVPGSVDQDLIVKRNHNMANRMEKIMVDKPIFVAVGALHLPGPSGVIELLRQKGYTVKPLYSEHTGWVPEPLVKEPVAEVQDAFEQGYVLAPEGLEWEAWFPGQPVPIEELEGDLYSYEFREEEEDAPTYMLTFNGTEHVEQGRNSLNFLTMSYIRPMHLEDTPIPVKIGGFEGHELRVPLAGDQQLRVRALSLSPTQVVVLSVKGTADQVDAETAERFLSSYKKSLPD